MVMKQQNRLAKSGSESLYYNILMAIPKNLVYVFLCIIVFAFLGMLFLLYSETDLGSFIDFQPEREQVVVHQLFTHLQKQMDQIQEVDQVFMDELTTQIFYEKYLSKNMPLHILDGCQNQKALNKWTNMSYLQQAFGSQSIQIHKLDKGWIKEMFEIQDNSTNNILIESIDEISKEFEYIYISDRIKRNNFQYFLNKSRDEQYDNYARFMYYIHREIIASPVLRMDVTKPYFLSDILSYRYLGLTIWKSFLRKPEFSNQERYICVVEGQEFFRLVSPVYKQNIYSGVYEDISPEETPLNFFNVNLDHFPLWAHVKYLDIEVEKGQCLYVPSFYWIQSQTLSQQTIFYAFEYQNNSELLNLIFQAIDYGILEKV